MEVSGSVLVGVLEVVVCRLLIKCWLQFVRRIEEIFRILVRIGKELLAFTNLLILMILPAQSSQEIMVGANSFHTARMSLAEVATHSLDSSEFLPRSRLSSFKLAKQSRLSFAFTLSRV